MPNRLDIELLFEQLVTSQELLSFTASSPRSRLSPSKIQGRSVAIKDKWLVQLTESKGTQIFHRNLEREPLLLELAQILSDYKQLFVFSERADFHIMIGKKGNLTLLKKEATKSKGDSSHNRRKKYFFQEGAPLPFLIELGLMNKEGKVYPAKQDKFRQINRFLEMVDDVLDRQSHPIRIVDFGCGKAYLTFALFYFLKDKAGNAIDMIGIDSKEQVIRDCQSLAKKLQIDQQLRFIAGKIEDYPQREQIDLVVSLHACNTATDAALEKAITGKAKVILCAPCCQHELIPQLASSSLAPLLKHGILRERFASLATDAARAQLLETCGYQTEVLEFIDAEHTPKNILIRAVRRSPNPERQRAAMETYCAFKEALHIAPLLETRLSRLC